MLTRRGLIAGLASLLAAPAIVRVENIMPVRAVILTPPEPLIIGIRYQTWPFGSPCPEYDDNIGIMEGMTKTTDGTGRAIEHWLKRIAKHDRVWPELHWKPITADEFYKRA